MKTTTTPMLRLADQYITHRRAMGYQLRGASTLLSGFGRFCAQAAPGSPIKTALAMRWANARPTLRTRTRAGRLGLVRGFARYCSAIDSRTEIPPPGLLATRFQRGTPHIFTASEIRLIIGRAKRLSDFRAPLHAKTYATLIGLLTCTGLRPGEAVRIRLADFDASSGLLRIARCKFSAERTIPLHPSCVRALSSYRNARLRSFPFGEHFFAAAYGRALSLGRVERVFRRLSADIPCRGDSPLVRLYDFRHTFATNLIARWSCERQPIAHHLTLLSRYLGHSGFNSTWWYVSSDSRSLKTAAKRFQRFHTASTDL